jgi:hypothetical protein
MSPNRIDASLHVVPQVTVNPEGAAADALRQWWDAEGSSAGLTPLGQAAAAGGAGGGPRSNKLQFLSDVLVRVGAAMDVINGVVVSLFG